MQRHTSLLPSLALAAFLASSCATLEEGLSGFDGIAVPPAAPNAGGGDLVIGGDVTGQIRAPNLANEYRFAATAGQELQILAENRSRRATRIDAHIDNLIGNRELGRVRAHAGRDWPGNSSMVFDVPEDGVYTIRVTGPFSSAEPNLYRIRVVERNRAPESIPASVSIGERISGEAIDLPHDIDEFEFPARAGQRLQIVLQSVARGVHRVDGEVENLIGNRTLGQVRAHAGREWMDNTSRPFEVPEDGTYTLRISGTFNAQHPNPYRFMIMEVN